MTFIDLLFLTEGSNRYQIGFHRTSSTWFLKESPKPTNAGAFYYSTDLCDQCNDEMAWRLGPYIVQIAHDLSFQTYPDIDALVNPDNRAGKAWKQKQKLDKYALPPTKQWSPDVMRPSKGRSDVIGSTTNFDSIFPMRWIKYPNIDYKHIGGPAPKFNMNCNDIKDLNKWNLIIDIKEIRKKQMKTNISMQAKEELPNVGISW